MRRKLSSIQRQELLSSGCSHAWPGAGASGLGSELAAWGALGQAVTECVVEVGTERGCVGAGLGESQNLAGCSLRKVAGFGCLQGNKGRREDGAEILVCWVSDSFIQSLKWLSEGGVPWLGSLTVSQNLMVFSESILRTPSPRIGFCPIFMVLW